MRVDAFSPQKSSPKHFPDKPASSQPAGRPARPASQPASQPAGQPASRANGAEQSQADLTRPKRARTPESHHAGQPAWYARQEARSTHWDPVGGLSNDFYDYGGGAGAPITTHFRRTIKTRMWMFRLIVALMVFITYGVNNAFGGSKRTTKPSSCS